MTDGDITELRMETLYEEPKQLIEPVDWVQNDDPRHTYSMRVEAETIEHQDLLTVTGEYWQKAYSFTLMYQNIPIRVWDFSGHHDGIEDGHKHRYPIYDQKPDDPYDVDDVTTTGVNQALLDFLDECNIRYEHVTINKITGLNHYG